MEVWNEWPGQRVSKAGNARRPGQGPLSPNFLIGPSAVELNLPRIVHDAIQRPPLDHQQHQSNVECKNCVKPPSLKVNSSPFQASFSIEDRILGASHEAELDSL